MRLSITILLITTTITLFSQQDLEALVGKWQYQDVYEKEKLDSTSLETLEMFFGEMTISFNENGLYKAFIMGKEDKGKWMAKGENVIELALDKGTIMPMKIIELEAERLVFELQNSAFVMTKLAVGEMEKIIETEPSFETVSATKEQVAKKWYLKSKESSKSVSDKVRKATDELLSGSYMKFSKNGKYKVQIFKIKEKGKWKFGEENKSIITIKDDNKKVWNIISISEKELVLVQGLNEEKWMFEAK
ncbi:MAG: lipocalin family protein [Pseudomonadota bacterium]